MFILAVEIILECGCIVVDVFAFFEFFAGLDFGCYFAVAFENRIHEDV